MQQHNTLFTACFQHQEAQSLLRAVVAMLRPASPKKSAAADARMLAFADWLEANESYRQQLSSAILELIENSDLTFTFTESGLLTGNGFFAELHHRLSDKILPHLLPHNDLRLVVRRVFSESHDPKWMQQVKLSSWIRLSKTLRINANLQSEVHRQQLTEAGEILSLRIASLGMEPLVAQKNPEAITPVNAFTAQYIDWTRYKLQYLQSDGGAGDRSSYSRLMQSIDLAQRQVRELLLLKKTKGTSLQQTFIVERLRQYLERLQILVVLLDPAIEVPLQSYVEMFLQVVHNENTQNRIRPLFSRNLSYLAFQIAEHGSRTGEKYITSDRREYWQFFAAAAIGGFIISFAALIKVGLTNMHLPYFWASLLYGINYAIAFVVIHFLHGTIATKQPALTASTIANAIGSAQHSTRNLAYLIAQVSRSQFASLMGNLVVVFPLCVLLAWCFSILTGGPILAPDHAAAMLGDVQLSLRNVWFASIAGMLLFGSGIISGYFDNLVIYGNIPERMKVHKGLQRLAGKSGAQKAARYIEKNLGALMGNIVLGLGLGFMIFFGKILGIPLDIRHVTISTGFFAFSLTSLNFLVSVNILITCLAGLAAIAFTNLAVSFAFALYVALRSRQIETIRAMPLLGLTVKYFLHFPYHFFLPPRQAKTPQEVESELA